MTEQKQNEPQPTAKAAPKGLAARWQALAGGERKLVFRLSVVLVVGLILMYASGLWGGSGEPAAAANNTVTEPRATVSATEEDLEAKLLRILQAVEGAGEVQVALSFRESASSEYVINTDTSTSNSEETDESGKRILSTQETESRSLAEIDSQPVRIKETMPLLCGAVIVAEGAADAAVREQLFQAARTLLGLPGHRITVLKLGE